MNTADPESVEIERIRLEYGKRSQEIPQDFYCLYREENLFFHTQVSRACLRLLRRNSIFPLSELCIADIGCGNGQWLLEFLQWGAISLNLHGIDLLPERIAAAKKRLGETHLTCGDARQLPWPDHSFHLVTQFMMFSSVLDEQVRVKIAQEMLRVLRPDGRILWFDTRRNSPGNPAVRGLKNRQLASLFPHSSIQYKKVILVPPIARALVKKSWTAALVLEKMPFACTHLVALINPAK